MRISVVIPAYNEEDYLEACLKSLMKQHRLADEIIVVDNNSIDRTAAIAARYGAKVIKEATQGIWAAAAAGYDAATGGIIARCDADSMLPADWLDRIERRMQEERGCTLTGPGKFYDCPRWVATVADRLYMRAYFKSVGAALHHPPLFGSNFAMRRTDWQSVRSSVHSARQDIHDDIDLSFHIGLLTRTVYDDGLRAEVSSRPFKRPLGMMKRYVSGFRTIFLHWKNEKPWNRKKELFKKSRCGT